MARHAGKAAGPALLFARLWRRRRRGFAMFEVIVALAVLGTLVTAGLLWLDEQKKHTLEEEAGRQVALLGAAAEHWAWDNYPALTATTHTAVPMSTLKVQGVLPQSFAGGGSESVDAMRRTLKVWYVRFSSPVEAVRVLAGQVDLAANDARLPYRALFQGGGSVRLGMVRTSGCPSGVTAPCLVGPNVQATIQQFDNLEISHGAVMALHEVTKDDFCGDYIMRQAMTACPDSNRMDTDLNMGNNDLQNGGTVQAGNLRVDNDMTVTGAFSVAGALNVDKTLEASGDITVHGNARVYGNIEADQNITVSGAFTVRGTIDVEDDIRADQLTVGTGTIGGNGEVRQSLSVGTCAGCGG